MRLIRNIIRTFYIYLFSEWASIPIWRSKSFQQYFQKAIKSYECGDNEYKEAGNNGLFCTIDNLEKVNPFAENYIHPSDDDYFDKLECYSSKSVSMREYKEKVEEDIKIIAILLKKSRVPILTTTVWMLSQSIGPNGSWYGSVDEIYLLASYLFARKYGATTSQAVYWAHKWLPFQPAYFSAPIVQGVRKFGGIGQFLSIIIYSSFRFLETHITRPWVIIGTIMTICSFIVMIFISLGMIFIGKFIGTDRTFFNS